LNMLNKKVEIQKGRAVITETKEIELADGEGIQELRRKLKTELGDIVRSVKLMKERAFEIKKILVEIERQEKEQPIKEGQ
jgi:hypothetical protein